MSEAFRYFLRVHYGDCDAQKVVFNARYGDYVDWAVTEFFRALGFESELSDGTLDYQLVRQCIDWKAPARFDDVVAVTVECSHQGTTSFRLQASFRNARTGTTLAEAETVYVLVDSKLAKRELPNALRRALESGARDLSTDHAAFLRAQG